VESFHRSGEIPAAHANDSEVVPERGGRRARLERLQKRGLRLREFPALGERRGEPARGLLVAGVTSYLFLKVAKVALGSDEAVQPIASLWIATFALAPGFFLPVEQELARTLADADAAMKARNWGNAIAAYERIMSVTDGRNPLVLNNLAYAQDQVGNKQVALGYALRALKEAPQNPSVMDTAAWLLIQTGGDRARALQLLRAASDKAPQNAPIRAHLQAAQRS